MPQAREMTGVSSEQVSISRDALHKLIKAYCRESGVRNLQKHIEKVVYITVISCIFYHYIAYSNAIW